jgi:hypothetical protein
VPAPKREAGTLFERMSSMARAGGKVEDEPTPASAASRSTFRVS